MENHVKETTKEEGLLAAAARKIGSAAGAVVSLTGLHQTSAPAETDTSTVNGRFRKKNKTRLPRRVKKSLKKAPANGHPASK